MLDLSNPEVNLTTLLLVRPQDAHEALSLISSDDFTDEDCRLVFREMTALVAENRLSWDTLLESLTKTHGKEKAAMMFQWATQSAAPLEDSGSVRRYAMRIKNNSARRQIIESMECVIARAREENAKPEEVRQYALEQLWGIRGEADGAVAPAKQTANSFLEQVFREKTLSGDLGGLPTGMHSLDLKTTGIRPGEFWVVGGLPGRGKTSLGIQMAVANVERGNQTLVFSMEMTTIELLRRIEGQRLEMVRLLRNPRLMADQDWGELCENVADLASLPLYIDDSSSLKVGDLVSRAHLAIKQHGIKLIVVDYLQLLRAPGKELRERVGYAANQLRELAKNTGVPVVALSQLRRPQDINTRPTMLDVKESGDIEAHAHSVVLIYQPLSDDGKPTGEDEVIIGKQRNGSLGTIDAYFNPRTLTFCEREAVAPGSH